MTERATTEVYWGRGSVGDRHWVSGQAYPVVERYDSRRVMDFRADASAVYAAPGPGADETGGEFWSVAVTDPPEGGLSHFVIGMPSGLPLEEHYNCLVDAVEIQLGRTGLRMLVY